MELGKRITEIRKQNNMTQEDLAEKFHVTRQTISNWENGKSYPDIETLVCISNEFDVSLDMIIKGDKSMVRKITREQQQGKKMKMRIVIAAIITIVIVLVATIIMNNTTNELSPEDYEITVKEITLENVTVDEINEIAIYKDPDGGEYLEEDESKENGEKYVAPDTGVYVFKNEDYFSLMAEGKAYEVVVASDKTIDGWYLDKYHQGKILDINVYQSNANLIKKNQPSKVIGVCFGYFDEIHDDNTVVWKK